VNYEDLKTGMSTEDIQENLMSNNNEMDPFLLEAMKNPRDRLSILKIEKNLEDFMKDLNLKEMEFPSMNGYLRMIVHKISHYFNLNHTFIPEKKAVLVNKTENSQIPTLKFQNMSKEKEEVEETTPPVKILSRTKTNVEKPVRILQKSKENNDTKQVETKSESKDTDDKSIQETLEEREKEYERARARIFKEQNNTKMDDQIDDQLELNGINPNLDNLYQENFLDYSVPDNQNEDYWSCDYYSISSNHSNTYNVYPQQMPLSYYNSPYNLPYGYQSYPSFYMSPNQNYIYGNTQNIENNNLFNNYKNFNNQTPKNNTKVYILEVELRNEQINKEEKETIKSSLNLSGAITITENTESKIIAIFKNIKSCNVAKCNLESLKRNDWEIKLIEKNNDSISSTVYK